MPQPISSEDESIHRTITEQSGRLRNFIRNNVADRNDVEDILQDAFYELVVAYRLMKPIENAGAWLFRVVRNRVTDGFRKQKTRGGATGEAEFTDSLVSPADGPEKLYWRSFLRHEIEDALDRLPDEQREVFLAHEVEGRSFQELAAETGVSINTLLSRKRYAVQALRRALPGGIEV